MQFYHFVTSFLKKTTLFMRRLNFNEFFFMYFSFFMNSKFFLMIFLIFSNIDNITFILISVYNYKNIYFTKNNMDSIIR